MTNDEIRAKIADILGEHDGTAILGASEEEERTRLEYIADWAMAASNNNDSFGCMLKAIVDMTFRKQPFQMIVQWDGKSNGALTFCDYVVLQIIDGEVAGEPSPNEDFLSEVTP